MRNFHLYKFPDGQMQAPLYRDNLFFMKYPYRDFSWNNPIQDP